MRLKEYYITEKLDLNAPIKVIENSPYTWIATWEVDGAKYQFVADRDTDIDDEVDNDSWGITFWDMSERGMWSQGETKITGKMGSKSLQVFSYVGSAFKKFIQQKKPDNFYFSAEERSRVRLYDRFAKMIAQKIKYKLDAGKQDGDSFYDFTRK